jgi:hypothetical protein
MGTLDRNGCDPDGFWYREAYLMPGVGEVVNEVDPDDYESQVEKRIEQDMEAFVAEHEAAEAAKSLWDRTLEYIKHKRMFILAEDNYYEEKAAEAKRRSHLKCKERVAEDVTAIQWQKMRWLYKDGNSYYTPRVWYDRGGFKQIDCRWYDTAWLTVKAICHSEYGTQHTSSLPYKTLKQKLLTYETKLHEGKFEYTWALKAEGKVALKVVAEAIRQTNKHLKRNGWAKQAKGDWINTKRKRTKQSKARKLYERGRQIALDASSYTGW